MSQHEFIAVYVVVPLLIAVGWLLWRARWALRGLVLYALAIAALVAFIRLGHLTWRTWEYLTTSPPEIYTTCADARARMQERPSTSCWM